MNEIETLIKWIKESDRIVFFGGAGVSTESGLKDFRSEDGLYHEKYSYPPEEILSHHFYEKNKEEFFKFYKDKLNTKGYKPNITHKTLKKLEEKKYLSSIITQNIDGFHQEAGSKKVLELHGSIKRNYCEKCHKFYSEKYVFESKGIPLCDCGGTIKPDVVLYEEPLNEKITEEAIEEIKKADMLIIGGTSLNVYPAASYIHFFNGKHLVLINKQKTQYDNICDLVLHESLGKVFKEIEKEIN